jgi:hypothetical protein
MHHDDQDVVADGRRGSFLFLPPPAIAYIIIFNMIHTPHTKLYNQSPRLSVPIRFSRREGFERASRGSLSASRLWIPSRCFRENSTDQSHAENSDAGKQGFLGEPKGLTGVHVADVVGDQGSRVQLALARVRKAQESYASATQEDVGAIFERAALAANMNRIPLAKLAVAETRIGLVEDKVIKNHFASEEIYNRYKNEKTV